MFYKYRVDDRSIDWVILMLKLEILWNKQCAFCCHNAATTSISQQPLEALTTEASFKGMFEEIDGYPTREEQKLRPYDPTDVQAEVMVFDIIEPEYIRGIVFNSKETRDANAHLLGDAQQTWVHPRDKGLFAARSYARKYT
ncbi:hypothetical protein RPSD_02920 [Ralstonia solanacearum]|nr:hypothetical protein RPSD_02920 [Ralstonia solanacearum]